MLRLQADPSFLDSRSTLEIALILGGVAIAAIVLAIVAFRIRSRWLLAATLALGVVQLFGPFGFTSFALLATCVLFPTAAWRARHRLRNVRSAATIWALLLAALAVWQTVAVLWSAKLGAAGYGVIFSGALLTAYLLALDVRERDPKGVPASIAIVSPLVILSGLVVIAFRLWPQLEAAYLLSPVARLFSEPDVTLITQSEVDIALDPVGTLGLFASVARAPGTPLGLLDSLFGDEDPTGFQNVLSPDKAGGVFLNGNTASLFFGIAACAALWALAHGHRRALHAATAIVSTVALAMTGSMTAVLLLVALPILALFLAFLVRRPRIGSVIGIAGVAVGAGSAAAVALVKPDIVSSGTLGDRLSLWRMVGDAFPERWFTGFGFGNWRHYVVGVWDDYFPDIATQIWPPHNLILQAWVDAGIVAVVLTLALIVVSIAGSVRRIGEARRDPFLGGATIRACVVFIGLAWVFLHGMADTTFFAGDNHTLPFVALLTALALTPAGAPRESASRRLDA